MYKILFKAFLFTMPLMGFAEENEAIGLISSNLARREAADSVVCDKGIAVAISEEQNALDATSQPDKLDKIKPIAENKAAIELTRVHNFNSFRDKAISTYTQGTIHYIPEIKKHEALFKEFFDKHMDVESYQAEIIRRLPEEFNEQELKELAGFYGPERESMEYASKIRPLFDRLNILHNQVTKEAFDRALEHKPELVNAIRQATNREHP